MAGFKAGFAELVGLLPAKRRVVVLVDDLDRCLPQATTATLEAIKLFLSVPKMVFVIAADQDMVRDAIAMNLGASPESSRYAQRYLDKIVQLPISLPVLPTHEAEAYLGLLLARPHMSDAEFAALADHVQARRIAGHAHLLSEMDELESAPSDETVRLASRLVLGLRADKVVNPRELKRFLNAYHVRARVAEVRGLDVRPDVLAKLLILEDRFPADFDTLLAASDAERKALLEKWGEWARDETGKAPKPDGISDDSREWAAVEPDLAPESIGPYLTLAASFASKRQSGTVIDADIAALVTDLTGDSEALRRGALDKVMNRSEGDQRVVLESLLSDARVRATPTTTITSLIQLGNEVEALTQDVAVGLKESCWNQIDVGNAVELASATSPVLLRMAQELVDDDALDGQVRQAARGILHPEATD